MLTISKKKVTIEEWNKEFFNAWTKIKRIVPHFEEWSSSPDEDDDPTSKWNEIVRIDIEFDDGRKVSIIPKSNREDDEDLYLALDIVQFKPQTVNWRVA